MREPPYALQTVRNLLGKTFIGYFGRIVQETGFSGDSVKMIKDLTQEESETALRDLLAQRTSAAG